MLSSLWEGRAWLERAADVYFSAYEVVGVFGDSKREACRCFRCGVAILPELKGRLNHKEKLRLSTGIKCDRHFYKDVLQAYKQKTLSSLWIKNRPIESESYKRILEFG